jgi:hypothetical protein
LTVLHHSIDDETEKRDSTLVHIRKFMKDDSYFGEKSGPEGFPKFIFKPLVAG